GSKHFSRLAANTRLRSAFVDQTAKVVTDHSLTGVDIDWEFPGTEGDKGNVADAAHDSDNILKLLTQLGDRLPSPYLITAATLVTVFAKNGRSMGDVSGFASLLDHVYPMFYDIYPRLGGPHWP
ncbi:glycoside hydrolase superfamily, partial [Geranomyces variabilis]